VPRSTCGELERPRPASREQIFMAQANGNQN
jgi:hypothetical protein